MKKAFTLAEVLLTLAIIGVVAVISIPSVLVNTQQHEFKTGLKKAVSVLNQALMTNVAIDEDSPITNPDLYDFLKKHMSILKEEKIFACVEDTESGEACPDSGVYNRAFYTTDGMRYEVSERTGASNIKLYDNIIEIKGEGEEEFNGNDLMMPGSDDDKIMGKCGSYGLAQNPDNVKRRPCVVTVDVNGDKGPSKPVGDEIEDATTKMVKKGIKYKIPAPTDKRITDVFTIIVTESKAVPFGIIAQKNDV